MSIKSVNNLRVRETYYVCLSKGGNSIKSKYIGCVKEEYGPDFYFQHLEKKGFKGVTAFFGMNEIGVGYTKKEAQENYEEILNELPNIYFSNVNEMNML